MTAAASFRAPIRFVGYPKPRQLQCLPRQTLAHRERRQFVVATGLPRVEARTLARQYEPQAQGVVDPVQHATEALLVKVVLAGR